MNNEIRCQWTSKSHYKLFCRCLLQRWVECLWRCGLFLLFYSLYFANNVSCSKKKLSKASCCHINIFIFKDKLMVFIIYSKFYQLWVLRKRFCIYLMNVYFIRTFMLRCRTVSEANLRKWPKRSRSELFNHSWELFLGEHWVRFMWNDLGDKTRMCCISARARPFM